MLNGELGEADRMESHVLSVKAQIPQHTVIAV